MISPGTCVQIRRYFYAEHWKSAPLPANLTLTATPFATPSNRIASIVLQPMRPWITDPYMEFVRQILDQHPRLRATRIHQMIRERGYTGSIIQLRRAVARLRPAAREPFLKLKAFPAEQAQVDGAHFGHVAVGRARRTSSCFVATLSWSGALYLEFFFDQTMENFLRGHVHAFEDWSGQPRVILYDNLRSAVLERRGNEIHFNPRLMELCAHYHFVARPCQVRACRQSETGASSERSAMCANLSGPAVPSPRSPNAIGRHGSGAIRWRTSGVGGWNNDSRTVAEVFAEEQPRLLPKPAHPFQTDLVLPVRAAKTIYVRFDLNDYSIPPEAVGRQLTLVASDSLVRILERSAEIARHPRTYDRRHQLVLYPAHQEAVLKTKRKAFYSTPGGRLALAAPESKALIDLAFAQGESAGSQTAQLLKLLDLYGPAALRRAINEALERNIDQRRRLRFCCANSSDPRPRRWRSISASPRNPGDQVRPHDLETYDELARSDDDDSEQ